MHTPADCDRELVFLSTNIPAASFFEKLEAAEAGEFSAITLWKQDIDSAKADGLSYADVNSALQDKGLRVAGVDCLVNWLPNQQIPDVPIFKATEDDLYEIASETGASWMNIAQPFGATIDLQETVDRFSAICERANDVGLNVSLEFLPWSGISDAATALQIVEESCADNARVAIDLWHFYRGSNDLEEIRRIPVERIENLQINDALAVPEGDLLTETSNRLLPGEGDSPLAEMLRIILIEKGYRGPVGVEAPSDRLSSLPPATTGALCGESARRVLQQLGL